MGTSQGVEADLTCQQVVAVLAAYLAGALAPHTALALQEHLRDCEDCEAFLRTYRATLDAIRSLRYEDVPAALQSRVRAWLQETTGYEGPAGYGNAKRP